MLFKGDVPLLPEEVGAGMTASPQAGDGGAHLAGRGRRVGRFADAPATDDDRDRQFLEKGQQLDIEAAGHGDFEAHVNQLPDGVFIVFVPLPGRVLLIPAAMVDHPLHAHFAPFCGPGDDIAHARSVPSASLCPACGPRPAPI